jgi:hypothetical protein
LRRRSSHRIAVRKGFLTAQNTDAVRNPLLTAFDFYFIPKAFERCGFVYKILGVEIFRLVILATVGKFVSLLRKREALYTYFVANPLSLRSVERTEAWSRFNEIVHFALIFITFFIGRAIYLKGFKSGAALLGLVVLLNIYLVLLQRYNRVKLVRMMELLERRARKLR